MKDDCVVIKPDDLSTLSGQALLDALEKLTLKKFQMSLQDVMSPDLPRLVARFTHEQREVIFGLRDTIRRLEEIRAGFGFGDPGS